MTDRQAYVAFNLTDNVGFATVRELADKAGSVAAAWEAYPKKVSRTGGEVDWEGEFKLAEKYGVALWFVVTGVATCVLVAVNLVLLTILEHRQGV